MAETVAFLFSDVQGSTRLLSTVGAERYGELLTAYRDVVERRAAEEGGKVVDREGDGLFLAFPTAAAAVRAACGAQRSLGAEEWPHDTRLAVRMGIHAGEAERHADGFVGLAVHRAARVASAAHGGQVLVSEAARALAADDMPPEVGLRDLGEHRLKDLERREHLYQLTGPGLDARFPPPQSLDAFPNNLPLQPTSFVGREQELADVGRLLEGERLITLTGVGGSGKSRLALQAAARAVDRHGDGVWVVELAVVRDPEDVVGQVAAVLGIREDQAASRGAGVPALRDRLVEHLERRELLLVLDNCEHLLDTVRQLADLVLRSCPRVQILVTSREGLGIAGETIWRVPSLAIATEHEGREEASDAVRLFTERARAVAPSFELNTATRAGVVHVCRRLDGIPLAIELAAARMRVLGIDQLAARLDDRFRLLTGGSRTALPRQQTLEATIDWSYQHLTDAERTLFARLAVFAGGFTLEAAEDVCAGGIVDETDVADLVFHLADKSLVTPIEGPAGPARYRLLETLRQYARTRLAEAGEAERVRDRHRDRFLSLAASARTELVGPPRLAWLDELEGEHDNLVAALEWSLATAGNGAISTLAAALARRSSGQGHHRRAVEYWRTAIEHAETDDREWQARLRYELSADLSAAGESDPALAEAERARELVLDLPASPTRVRVLGRYANVVRSHVRRAPDDAMPAATEAVADARELGEPGLLSGALRTLGVASAWIGDIDGGVAQLDEALALARRADDRDAIGAAYHSLALVLHDLGHRAEESGRLEQELQSWLRSLADQSTWGFDLWGMLCYFPLRRGEWATVEERLERIGAYHLEGFSRAWLLQVRGALRWMQGRLAEAAEDAAELRSLGIARWDHDLFPLVAEIAAAEGRLDHVRSAAEEYLGRAVHPTEEVMKTAVLAPLVRAEIDAALAAGDRRAEHLERAGESARRAIELLERYPPVAPGGIQFETPAVYVLLVEAELSRGTDPKPDLWRRVKDEAWYAYTRLYARWRLAEALVASDRRDEARQELIDAHREAVDRGAGLIARWCEDLATTRGIPLDDGA